GDPPRSAPVEGGPRAAPARPRGRGRRALPRPPSPHARPPPDLRPLRRRREAPHARRAALSSRGRSRPPPRAAPDPLPPDPIPGEPLPRLGGPGDPLAAPRPPPPPAVRRRRGRRVSSDLGLARAAPRPLPTDPPAAVPPPRPRSLGARGVDDRPPRTSLR